MSGFGGSTSGGSVTVTGGSLETTQTLVKVDVDKIPSKGTAAMAGSMPVTIATSTQVAGVYTATVVPSNNYQGDSTRQYYIASVQLVQGSTPGDIVQTTTVPVDSGPLNRY